MAVLPTEVVFSSKLDAFFDARFSRDDCSWAVVQRGGVLCGRPPLADMTPEAAEVLHAAVLFGSGVGGPAESLPLEVAGRRWVFIRKASDAVVAMQHSAADASWSGLPPPRLPPKAASLVARTLGEGFVAAVVPLPPHRALPCVREALSSLTAAAP
eukprot:TRINITY_DN47240_c0_g1_i1.p1 TRINITY_DN47240_c0_g1~~TRINITY_DN47240_c0_g1_i1.p1  ORF type:complete len:156 (+),score=38.44 TRINITY_DN47240_c0_g1_i1:57-524(+)